MSDINDREAGEHQQGLGKALVHGRGTAMATESVRTRIQRDECPHAHVAL